MSSLLDELADHERALLRKRAQPRWLQPMMATLTHKRFSDPDWIYERKLDGERVLGFGAGGKVRLLSRNAKNLGDTYPEVVDALRAQDVGEFIVDGEVVAFEGNQTSFARLQGRLQIRDPVRARNSGIAVYCYLFDLVHLVGYDLSQLPLVRRKSLLRKAIGYEDPLRFLPHRAEHGEAYYGEACANGWEGLIAKRASSHYVSRRSTDWLKFKCVAEQEFVIGGFTDPRGSRHGLGALLVGYYDDGRLRYAGKVGTGYTTRTLDDLSRRLRPLERAIPPFEPSGALPRHGVHWVEPELVAQIGFTEWTGDGRLRHPRFLGLRPDKRPREVVRESTEEESAHDG